MSIYDSFKRFPDVHPNIVLKTDLLRQGMTIGNAAVEQFQKMEDVLWKGFHLFSYDSKKTVVYGDKVPALFHLDDGTPIQVRTNPDSPYSLDLTDDGFVVAENQEVLAKGIYFERKPRWYDMKTSTGVQMPAIVQGFCRLLFVTINKYCELWNAGEQCLFCNINATLADQRAGGEDTVARLDPEVIAEVVKTALTVDHHYYFLYISGGTILGKYRGQTELDFLCTRLDALREKLQVWIPATVQIAAQGDEGWRRVHETGVGSIQPNIEVWDKRLFQWICPGKDKHVGYDEWIKRTVRAVDFWGPGRVNPNFVLGVEMAKPHGFQDVASAVKSTASGWDYLMSHGVVPRFNLWIIEAGSRFYEQEQQLIPLEYFIEAQKAYTELRWKHGFEPPFPAAADRYSYLHNCLQDFEYYHGSGPTSKKALDANMRLGENDVSYFDQEGYTYVKPTGR